MLNERKVSRTLRTVHQTLIPWRDRYNLSVHLHPSIMLTRNQALESSSTTRRNMPYCASSCKTSSKAPCPRHVAASAHNELMTICREGVSPTGKHTPAALLRRALVCCLPTESNVLAAVIEYLRRESGSLLRSGSNMIHLSAVCLSWRRINRTCAEEWLAGSHRPTNFDWSIPNFATYLRGAVHNTTVGDALYSIPGGLVCACGLVATVRQLLSLPGQSGDPLPD